MSNGIVYKITSPSGKVYVGSTINFKKRLKHYRLLDCKAQIKLYNSFVKYGYENHKIEILEECDTGILLSRERYYGLLFNSITDGLNLTLPRDGECKGIISIETKNRMSKTQQGSGNNFYGRKVSEEAKEKRRKTYLNLTDESRKRISDAQKGKKASLEARLKMSKSQTGRKHNERTKTSMRDNNQNLKLVVCLQTGIFYNGTNDAATAYGMNRHTLKNKLNGNKRNDTQLMYI